MIQWISNFLLRTSGRAQAAAVLLAATVALSLPLTVVDNARHTYLLQEAGAEPTFIYGTAEAEADYALLRVRPSRSQRVGDAQLLLERDQAVTVRHGERTERLAARGETVDHLLRRLRIEPAEGEMVVLDMTGHILEITVTDTWEYSWENAVPTTHATERVANPALLQGQERVKQEGQDGEYVETFLNVYTEDGLQSTDLVDRSEDTAVTEIVEYGTAVQSVASVDQLSAVTESEEGEGGYLTFASGATMPYSKVLTCEATAYCIHGTTATGYPTAMGNVAVDPKVIPYGTRMYIQTPSGSWVYGMAVARDCGGAIKGNMIDLWFPDLGTCIQWGRRNITVYILD